MRKSSLLALLSALSLLLSCQKTADAAPVDPEPVDPVPETVTYSHKCAFWEISSSVASHAAQSWTADNKFYANKGDGASAAFAFTTGSNVNRLKNGNNISASNLSEDCSIDFIWPSVSVAAGSTVDFMGCFYTASAASPKYWIFEYYEDGRWKSVEEDLRVAKEDPSLKYSFHLYKTDDQYATFAQSFTLDKAITSGSLQMRVRVVGKYNTGGGTLSASTAACVGFVNMNWRGASIDIHQGVTKKDTRKVLEIGNSFSYYYGTPFLLKELAMSQGHNIRLRAFNKGGRYFSDHNSLEMSLAQVNDGGFDYAVLQDQSGQHALYGSDPVANAAVLNDTKTYFNTVRAASPSVKIVLENTWAYAGSSGTYPDYGSYAKFDRYLQDGTRSICARTGATMSPIGIAFQKARSEGGQGSVSVLTNVDFKATTDASWVTLSTTKDKISWKVSPNADIDLTGKTRTPICLPTKALSVPYNSLVEPTENPFKGTFNGNGHTIRGLSMEVDIQKTRFYGMFATSDGATIRDLKLQDASLVIRGSGISSSHSDVALLV